MSFFCLVFSLKEAIFSFFDQNMKKIQVNDYDHEGLSSNKFSLLFL